MIQYNTETLGVSEGRAGAISAGSEIAPLGDVLEELQKTFGDRILHFLSGLYARVIRRFSTLTTVGIVVLPNRTYADFVVHGGLSLPSLEQRLCQKVKANMCFI
jgi:hypothetical protein